MSIEALILKLAETLRDVMRADPDLPDYEEIMARAEAVLAEAVAAGLIPPDDC